MSVPADEVRTELCGDRAADVVKAIGEANGLRAIEMTEDRLEPILFDGFGLIERLGAAGRDADEDDASVVRDPDTFDETLLLHSIDDAGGIAERHVEQFGHPAHRQVAVMLEKPHDVHVGHAHPGLDETACACASESRDDVVDSGRDPRGQRFSVDSCRRVNSSHEMNNLTAGNHRVNMDHQQHDIEGGRLCVSH
jgi:hypothetical protein